jgi:hypothetical protein
MKTSSHQQILRKGNGPIDSFFFIDTHSSTCIKLSMKRVIKDIPESFYLRFKYLFGCDSRVVETLSVADFKEKYLQKNECFPVQKNSQVEELILELGLMIGNEFVMLTDPSKINFNHTTPDHRPLYSNLEDFNVVMDVTISYPTEEEILQSIAEDKMCLC